MTAAELCRLLGALIESPATQTLWTVADRGVPVFVHSMDVALLCLDAYPDYRERYPGFRLDVVLVGCVLHDLSKASARLGDGPSHSQIMTHAPHLAVSEAVTVLDAAQQTARVWLDEEAIDHVWHVIAAHHGRWGKVTPQTPEAYLLAASDNYSALNHRIPPIDANDILPLFQEGYRSVQIGERLGVNRGIVKARLRDACQAEGVRSPVELLDRWRERGEVVIADPERQRQIARSRFMVDFAKHCPSVLLEKVRLALPLEPDRTEV